jgi:hypothetical protein
MDDRWLHAGSGRTEGLIFTETLESGQWDELSPENFDTTTLLRAVDPADELGVELNDGEDGSAPQLSDDLLKLHQLARTERHFQDGASHVATPPLTSCWSTVLQIRV